MNSRKAWMRPARFLHTWEALQIDIQDLHQVSAAGNRYLLVMVDRASIFLLRYPLASNGSQEVSRKLVMLMLTFDVPQTIRSDGGEEFTAQVVSHLSRWLIIALNHGPADFAWSQGAAERVGGSLQQVLLILSQKSRCSEIDQYVLFAYWI